MSKRHSHSPRDDDRDLPRKKRLDRKAKDRRRSKDSTFRKISPAPDADEFDAFLLEDEFDEASEFESDDEEYYDSDTDTDWDSEDSDR